MMSFPTQTSRVPTSIGKIWHIICDNPSSPETIRYVFQVLDQDGAVMRTECGDELPHLSAAQKQSLQVIVNEQKVKAEGTLP